MAKKYNPIYYKKVINEKLFNIKRGIVFCQKNIYEIEDEIKEIREKIGGIRLLAVLDKKHFNIIDLMYRLGVAEICFENNRKQVLTEVMAFLSDNTEINPHNYIINFYENRKVFFIDITGTLTLEKLNALKLMFRTYLQHKLKSLKGIVYVFNNPHDESISFQTIWALFSFWHQLDVDFNKVYYLTASKQVKKIVGKFLTPFGVRHRENLFVILKEIFPDAAKMRENELFDFASSFIES